MRTGGPKYIVFGAVSPGKSKSTSKTPHKSLWFASKIHIKILRPPLTTRAFEVSLGEHHFGEFQILQIIKL